MNSPPNGNPLPPRGSVLFVHIQKTAGMSLYNGLARCFGAENSRRYARSSPEFQQQFLRLPEAEILRLRLLSGHFDLPFWLQRPLGERLVVSLVRDPVERVLSVYRYARSWAGHRLHGTVGRMTPAEYVDYHVADLARHDWQCRRLCGEPRFAAARDMVLRHVDLLGAVEAMGAFTEALRERLGAPVDVGTDNRSADQHPKREDLDATLVARLQAANAEDCKLWEWVMAEGLIRGRGAADARG
jgi:Sulfotransferase family